jgi:flagellar L-ring protein precursor FlgH
MYPIHRIFWRFSLPVLVAALVAGCGGAPTRDPNYAPVRPVSPPSAPSGDGSLYHGGLSMNWFEDLRAQRVGDILTVKLSESTDASKSASTSTSKSNAQSISNPTVFGMQPQFYVPGLGAGDFSVGLGSEQAFDGDSSSSQTNQLSGDITVTVTEVLPNGNLLIRGEKRIGINQGNEYIRLSGIVRPFDVSADNTVESNKIADPTIVYAGDGALADANALGWLSRFFISAIMPF